MQTAMRSRSVAALFAASLTVAFVGLTGEGCGPQECPGGGGAGTWRCLNGVTPQWCSVGGGPSGGGGDPVPSDFVDTTPNTYTWESLPTCTAPSTCVLVPGNGNGAMCALSSSPVQECPTNAFAHACWEGFAVDCVRGFPTEAYGVSPCSDVCIAGVCAISSTPDTNCPDGGGDYATYCSATGPVACYRGFDVALDSGYGPSPSEGPSGSCPVTRDAGTDAGGE